MMFGSKPKPSNFKISLPVLEGFFVSGAYFCCVPQTKISMPKLEVPKFDPLAPLHNFEPDYELLNSIQEDIAEEKRKQERKTTIFAGLSILIGVIGLFLAYFTLDATLKANAANQAAANATNKLLQLEETVHQQQAQFLSYQAKNDSMSAIVVKMKAALKKHGIKE